MKYHSLLALACAAVVSFLPLATPAHAGKANDTLVWASNLELERADYYFNTQGEGVVLADLIWDRLIYRDPADPTKYSPMLATSWKWLNDVTLEIKLRPGVKFHNGDVLGADDVVYTLNWVADLKNNALGQWRLAWLKNAEKIDDLTVHLHLKAPFLAAIDHLAQAAPIYPAAYYKQVGPDGMSAKPVGTGPYRVTENVTGQRMVLKKNPDYYKDSPRGVPSIGTIVFRPIPDMTTQMAELIGGGVDFVWRLAPEHLDAISKMREFQTTVGGETRVGYLALDVLGRAGNHPLKDVRVRQAIAYAIDRNAIAKNFIGAGVSALDTPCAPVMFGCTTDAAVKYEYNPAKAKALLAEAGYPNGFSVDLDAYREREMAEAMVGYLRAVGIKANLIWQRYPTLRRKVRAGQSALSFMSFGSARIYDVTAIFRNFFQGSEDDMAQDPKVHEWLQLGENGRTPEERLKNYRLAIHRITETLPWIPVSTYSINYAFTRDLAFTAYDDGVPRFDLAKWK